MNEDIEPKEIARPVRIGFKYASIKDANNRIIVHHPFPISDEQWDQWLSDAEAIVNALNNNIGRNIYVDGENQAVRCFLALYGNQSCTIGDMRDHLKNSGFPFWPEWVNYENKQAHLTKSGAQIWLRHLFSLETDVLIQY